MVQKELRSQAPLLPVLLHVGKNGISDAFLDELKLLVKKKKLVKVKFLRSFADEHDMKTAVAEVAERASLTSIHVVGNTAVFGVRTK